VAAMAAAMAVAAMAVVEAVTVAPMAAVMAVAAMAVVELVAREVPAAWVPHLADTAGEDQMEDSVEVVENRSTQVSPLRRSRPARR
jgi:hypothetical protein